MHTSLRNGKALDNFLWLRKYGLKWFDSSPVKLTSIREADLERKAQTGEQCQRLPGNHEMEQKRCRLQHEGLEVTRS